MRFFTRVILFFSIITTLYPQQINISRVEQMPKMPQPYLMRDWKQVALGYDSLVFDLTRTGDYLPLIWINNNTVNYPNHSSFGLHTVVGTPSPSNAEAINVLPAVIGASLVGIDKSKQNGFNWVLGCKEWFNKRPEENVYLNNFVGNSGSDWWYDTMPNIFFYQLYDLYPGTSDFDYQFTTVADRWLAAVVAMDGSATPWNQPYMNYRAWELSSMTPSLATRGKQPEAAGAIAWLLYNAFTKTGEKKYRLGAEWSMEFLSGFSTNAAYELQLPYGVYTAARMNAELGTTYNVEKMLNWCFDPEGNVREWGVCLRNWGGYDCDGLVGEALNDGYAFVMNGFEMAGALVPTVRYDERFARAVGKWMLNLANASRLFYSPFLPDSLQDGEAWAKIYDPRGYIAHESMREFAIGSGVSPFATGDAMSDGWGATNFALYGSSHVGILGGIIDTTNVQGILKLDLRKTDYFQENAYPSYLYYNPHDQSKIVTIDVGDQVVDIYDAVNNEFLVRGVSARASITMPADEALLLVLVPAGGTITYAEEKMLVDGVAVDYNSGEPVSNHKPRIKALAADSTVVLFNQSVNIFCTARDKDHDPLSYVWTINGEGLDCDSAVLSWSAPTEDTLFTIRCTVSDGITPPVSDSIQITVVESINHAPVIEDLIASAGKIDMGDTTTISCIAGDPDGDMLDYFWSADYGLLIGSDSVVAWIAPDSVGYYFIKCTVRDNRGGEDTDSIGIVVRDSTNSQTGDPVAYYPFSGNANDESGLNNHGTVNGADLTTNRFGDPNSAYYFNGTSDNIRVPVSSSLNFTDAITVSFWMMPTQLFTDRETYPISHGNYENRWKVSIIPDQKIRWTVKTSDGIKDLDSQTKTAVNTWYHVVGLYDGSNFEIYINSNLDNHTSFSGTIMTTNIDLMIGQVLPNNSTYNFKGIIDDVRIYDYALSVEEIEALYGETSAIHPEIKSIPKNFSLMQNYPNPFNPMTMIKYDLPQAVTVKLQIFDLTGRLVQTLVNEHKPAGHYSAVWNAQNVSSGIYFIRLSAGDFTAVKKCVKLK
jgi:hypothetical protein